MRLDEIKAKAKVFFICMTLSITLLVIICMNAKIYVGEKVYIVVFDYTIDAKYESVDENGNVLNAPIATPIPKTKINIGKVGKVTNIKQ